MPNFAYIAAALAAAVAITVALRAIPFMAKGVISDSPLLADVGRWTPLGAIGILALYCLSKIDFTGGVHRIPELVGVAVTVIVHLWRRNAVLSIVAGTAACLLLANTSLLALP